MQEMVGELQHEMKDMVGELLQLRSWNTALEAEKDGLVESVGPLQETIRDLERNEELMMENQEVLGARLSASEAGEAKLQDELEQSQDATAAVVSELDRLRSSVEEIVLQRAMESDGVARVTVIDDGHRRATSGIVGERGGLTMEATPLKRREISNVEEARTKNEGANSGHRARSMLAFTMRPGF